MEIRFVTCPETAHLEMIEYETTPFGMVIGSCSRFRTECIEVCPGTCAARLDRRAAAERAGQRSVVIEVRSLLRGR